MGPHIYGKMKDIFFDLLIMKKKNKIPKFQEVYDEMKDRYTYIKTNMETARKKSQIQDIENLDRKHKEYKETYEYIIKQYKNGELRR